MSYETQLLIPGHTTAFASPDPPTVDYRQTVDGVNCKNGHFNDPSVHFCQVCGTSMAQLTLVPRKGIRPSLGVLLLDDSATYRLDAGYVIGREPGDLSGGARAIKLIHDVGGISRQHLRITLTGWTVQATDLGSANGTFLEIRGISELVPLQPHEPKDILPGTRIKLVKRWVRYESHRAGVLGSGTLS